MIIIGIHMIYIFHPDLNKSFCAVTWGIYFFINGIMIEYKARVIAKLMVIAVQSEDINLLKMTFR